MYLEPHSERINSPGIIQELGRIGFPWLETIDLGENQIESIEGLSRMRMPSLINLSLSTSVLTRLQLNHEGRRLEEVEPGCTRDAEFP